MKKENNSNEESSDSDSDTEKKRKKKEKEKEKEKSKKNKNEKKESEKPKEVLGYIEDFKYDIKITKASENSLIIALDSKEGTDKFESEFTLQDLIEENKVFLIFENIDEVIDNFKLVIQNEYLSLFLDMNNDFYFEFFIDINGNKKQVRLLLEPVNEDSKKLMAEKIQEQDKQIAKLENKNEEYFNMDKNLLIHILKGLENKGKCGLVKDGENYIAVKFIR